MDVRRSATVALVKIGKPAVPALLAALKDSSVSVRWQAAAALGNIGDAATVPALEAADCKDHENYFCEFCDALRHLGAR